MALQSLNIGNLTPAAVEALQHSPATGVPFDLAELGATGTPIFGGFLRELGEYNAELTGLSAYHVYEKMRRSDAQVAATLRSVKLPIRSAEWTIREHKDASPIEKEATELVRSCLMEELDFDAVIRNALLMLDFGAAAHEDVYYLDGDRVRIRKLAPRLPLTFYRWICAPGTDDLIALEQMGYRGSKYERAQVPVDKLSLFTFDQEGANFTGQSLCRAMYQHWFIKAGLYKVQAIACERNGMGVPWMKMGPGASKEDQAAGRNWITSVSANERLGMLMPSGWEFGLEGVKGVVQSAEPAIAHHNSMISMAALAQFINLGQGEKGGSRALGNTMSDFFYLGLQATANHIARVISLTTIKRLCDLNFTGIEHYPVLAPQQILSIKLESVVDALQKLSGLILSDDELEEYMRQRMGLPARGKPRAQAAKNPAASSAPAPAGFSEFTPSRAPRGVEKCVAFSEIASALDKGRDDVAAALRAARPRIQTEIVHKLMARPAKEAHRVSIDLDPQLVDQVRGILGDLQDYGQQTIADERTRQMKGAAPETARTIRAIAKTPKDNLLGLYADAVVSEFTNNLQQRAANVALDVRRKTEGKTTGQGILDAGAALDDQSEGWIDNVAGKGANEAFAAGRSAGYEDYADEIASVLYSSMLDPNSCGNCDDADGEEGKTPDDIPQVPNPDCEGKDLCRCVHVFKFADEGKAAA